jgi:hypothetical protein
MPLLHTRAIASLLVFGTLIAAGCSHKSMHESLGRSPPDAAQAHKEASQPATYSMQDDSSAWRRSPHLRAYYDMTVATFAHGKEIDVDAYEAQSFAIFREFARANHVSEQAMLDHLKLIPRQVVGIVKENPDVLASYDSFWVALVGPN